MPRQRPRARFLNRTAVRRAIGLAAAALLIAVAAWRVARAEPPGMRFSAASIRIEDEA